MAKPKRKSKSILALLPLGGGRVRAKRRNPHALMVNPRRKRRRRRNPSLAATVRGGLGDALALALPATFGGAAIGFVDSKIGGRFGFVGRTAVKLGVAIAAGTIGRKFLGARGGDVAMGAVLSTIGHEIGVRAGGGIVALTRREGVSALLDAAADDPEIAALLDAPPDEDAIGQGKGYLRSMATGAPTSHPYPELAAMEEDTYGEADADGYNDGDEYGDDDDA